LKRRAIVMQSRRDDRSAVALPGVQWHEDKF
jgi:hypothetical protein